MPAMPKREIFERIIQNITNKFPDVYAALFISPEGFPINTWGVSLERAEEISAQSQSGFCRNQRGNEEEALRRNGREKTGVLSVRDYLL